jgi:hypothetical protein
MKALVFAGLFTAALAPFAVAEASVDCPSEAARRTVVNTRPDVQAQAPARPVLADCEQQQRSARTEQRRRSGKPIPDAELIAPRVVL